MCLHTRCLFLAHLCHFLPTLCTFLSFSELLPFFFNDWQMCELHVYGTSLSGSQFCRGKQKPKKKQTRKKKTQKNLGPNPWLCALCFLQLLQFDLISLSPSILIKVMLTSDLTCSSSSCCQLAVKFIALFYQMTWNNASNFSSVIYMWSNSTEITHTEQRYVVFSWIFLTCKVYWKCTCLTTELLAGSLSKGIPDKPTFKSAGKRNFILYCRTLQYHLL